MSCGSGPKRNWCHNSLRDALHEYAVEAGLGQRKEVRCGTVVNPCQVATVAGVAAMPGHAITLAHNRNVRWAEEACQAQGLAFLPLVDQWWWRATVAGGRWRRT